MTTIHESTAAELGRARALWAACCLSPVIYMAIAMGLDKWLLAPSGRTGFWALAPDTLATVRYWCVCILMVLVTAAVIVRLRGLARPPVPGSIRRQTLWLVGLAECCIWPGVVMFVFGAGLRPVFVTGTMAFACYVIAYPGAPEPAGSGDDGKLTD